MARGQQALTSQELAKVPNCTTFYFSERHILIKSSFLWGFVLISFHICAQLLKIQNPDCRRPWFWASMMLCLRGIRLWEHEAITQGPLMTWKSCLWSEATESRKRKETGPGAGQTLPSVSLIDSEDPDRLSHDGEWRAERLWVITNHQAGASKFQNLREPGAGICAGPKDKLVVGIQKWAQFLLHLKRRH